MYGIKERKKKYLPNIPKFALLVAGLSSNQSCLFTDHNNLKKILFNCWFGASENPPPSKTSCYLKSHAIEDTYRSKEALGGLNDGTYDVL